MGRPYRLLAARVLDAVDTAREAARGHEAVLVSHQLPVWLARLAVEDRRLWHYPRRRHCSLASLTSIGFLDDEVVSVATAIRRPTAAAAGALPAAGA